jgi:hypothetical protein
MLQSSATINAINRSRAHLMHFQFSTQICRPTQFILNGGLARNEVNNVEPNQDGPITGLCGVSR